MSESNQKEGQRTSEVIAKLRDEGVEFFLNSENVPSLFIAEDHFQNDWPVASQRCQDYVETMWYEVSGKTLHDAQAKRFLYMQIREECRTGGRRLSQAEVPDAEKDPIIQGLMSLMNKQQSYSGRTSILKTELQKYDVGEQRGGIPEFTNIFSRRLKRLIPALQGMGISVRIEHREDGSFCEVERMPAFEVESDGIKPSDADDSSSDTSGQPSGPNPRAGKDLQLHDGSDGKERFDKPKSKAARKQQEHLKQPEAKASVDEGGAK